jgi:hypothetical protein
MLDAQPPERAQDRDAAEKKAGERTGKTRERPEFRGDGEIVAQTKASKKVSGFAFGVSRNSVRNLNFSERSFTSFRMAPLPILSF